MRFGGFPDRIQSIVLKRKADLCFDGIMEVLKRLVEGGAIATQAHFQRYDAPVPLFVYPENASTELHEASFSPDRTKGVMEFAAYFH